ncbi:ATPase, T2SS/T4P/T4SS family [Curtobacterium sp. MCJR17_043]|nr:ATPase, T2SS/T4P/T4SS family [Curtobacterium sp. MCJR17_043]WIB37117.1 ATPase, T2SS/T4P/T4SS family [Curtobacterium sp. MCJR17_043]
MVNPANVLAIDDARAASGRPIKPLQVDERDLLAAFDRYLRADDELNDLTSSLEEEASRSNEQQADIGDGSLDDVPIVRFVNLLVSQAIQDHASDIHIEPGEHEVRVRYRIDGVLHEMTPAPKNIQNGVISRLKIMSDIDIAERRKPQDGRMSVRHGGRQIDLRVATLPTVWGEKVVMRILDNTNTSLTLKDLNLLDRNAAAYQKSYSKPYGMILVTGPTGSGKSTTLYTTLNAVAKPEINVITVEDPVEYRMAGVNQVQVNPKAGLTFASALRSILRSDPDVVLLGEIRDHETAQIAIEASLTGHLVLSTLHTNDAPLGRHPPHRDGHRTVPGRVRPRLRRRPTPRTQALRPLQGARRVRGRAAARPRVPRRARRRRPGLLRSPRLRRVLEHRVPRAHRTARGDDRHGGDRAARRRPCLERGDRPCRPAAGHAHPPDGRVGEGQARTHERRRDPARGRVAPGGRADDRVRLRRDARQRRAGGRLAPRDARHARCRGRRSPCRTPRAGRAGGTDLVPARRGSRAVGGRLRPRRRPDRVVRAGRAARRRPRRAAAGRAGDPAGRGPAVDRHLRVRPVPGDRALAGGARGRDHEPPERRAARADPGGHADRQPRDQLHPPRARGGRLRPHHRPRAGRLPGRIGPARDRGRPADRAGRRVAPTRRAGRPVGPQQGHRRPQDAPVGRPGRAVRPGAGTRLRVLAVAGVPLPRELLPAARQLGERPSASSPRRSRR